MNNNQLQIVEKFEPKVKSAWRGWLVVLLLFGIIIVFFLLSWFKNFKDSECYQEKKNKAKRQCDRYKQILQKKEKLRKKLNRIFAIFYFLTRVLIFSIWVGIIYGLYHFNYIKDINDFLTYSELTIMVIIAVNFLLFGTFKDASKFVSEIRIQIENWVYGRYINLEESIKEDRKNVVKIEAELQEN